MKRISQHGGFRPTDLYVPEMFKRRLALVSDTHVGSRYSLGPDKWLGLEGNDISASFNKGQIMINEFWKHFLIVCKKWKVETLLTFGDLIQGNNKKEWGLQTVTSDLEEQKRGVVKLLKPFKELCHDRIYGVSGSGYHESMDSKVHADIMERLGGNYLGAICNFKVKGTDRVLNIAHGVSSAWIYQTMLMSREALFMAQAQQLGKLEVPVDVIIRGHWHRFIHIHQEHIHMVQLPGWQAYVPWRGSLLSYGRFQPDIGGCILFVDKADRITLHHYTMPKIPHIGDVIWEG